LTLLVYILEKSSQKSGQATGWTPENLWFDCREGQGIFSLFQKGQTGSLNFSVPPFTDRIDAKSILQHIMNL